MASHKVIMKPNAIRGYEHIGEIKKKPIGKEWNGKISLAKLMLLQLPMINIQCGVVEFSKPILTHTYGLRMFFFLTQNL